MSLIDFAGLMVLALVVLMVAALFLSAWWRDRATRLDSGQNRKRPKRRRAASAQPVFRPFMESQWSGRGESNP